MNWFYMFFSRTSLYKFLFSKRTISQLECERSKLADEIQTLEHKIEYQESVLKSILPLYDFEKSKIHNKFEYFQEMWMTWGVEIHSQPYQLKRQQRATDSIYTPLSFNGNTGKAYFRGKETDYFTSLLKCECMDFQRRNLPCKHMYRLAYELDVYMLDDVEVDPNINNLMKLSDALSLINRLSANKKEIFSCILDGSYYAKKSDVKSLLDCNLVQLCRDKRQLLNYYKKQDLFSLLPENINFKVPKSIKKKDLIDLLISTFPDVISNLEKLYVVVEPHDNIRHLIPSIQESL